MSAQRATCPHCRQAILIRVNGRLRGHRALDAQGRITRALCHGSGHAATTRQLIPHAEEVARAD
ncbi:hypothetical protein MXD62_20080 [Frankia sp. Mgl5]|uniref:hypothetical protein n=1 Tax=Frankia sp. Mgl5 TaxID=2933793 RepID=UPI00200D41FA|nr:hypothetical protein [Frankia sp. Mgl5]MCK9929450.1 hypothetical protein [Frankia sp. Mgl5]